MAGLGFDVRKRAAKSVPRSVKCVEVGPTLLRELGAPSKRGFHDARADAVERYSRL